MIRYTVADDEQDQRLDSFVVGKIKIISRSFVRKLSQQGKIKVNGELEKTSRKLKPGDKITVDYDPEENKRIQAVDLPVIYEDDNCIVINKPQGMLTHSKGVFNPEATVATFIASRVKDMDGDRAGIVHRLDRATSGVLIAAKNPKALAWLQKQFSQRRVKKTYIAVVSGVPDPEEAIINIPIERNPKKPQTFRAGNNGKPAVTKYKVVKYGNSSSLIRLEPETGRTHQLRVHLKHINHPIIGDTLYGGVTADRMYLHASSLEITLMDRSRKVFSAPLPKEFKKIVV